MWGLKNNVDEEISVLQDSVPKSLPQAPQKDQKKKSGPTSAPKPVRHTDRTLLPDQDMALPANHTELLLHLKHMVFATMQINAGSQQLN